MRKKSTAKSAAWKWFSKWVRLSRADEHGYVECVTCGKFDHWKNMQAGHFVAKSKGGAIYFEPSNVHPQCPRCNLYEHGNLIPYTLFIQREYGQDYPDRLRAQASQTVTMRLSDYEQIEAEYRERVKELGG